MTAPVLTKRCPYCQNQWPADDFKKLRRGTHGQVTVIQCGACYRARQNPAANKKRLETMVANNKAANQRAYGHFEKEKSR